MRLLRVSNKVHRKKIKILLVQITNKNFGDSVIADNTRSLLKKSTRWLFWNRYDILDYAINTEDVTQIQYVDAIVFAGGGLIKFRQENLYRQVSEIIMEAQKYDVPVFLNAVGVEGYDEKDIRCRQLVDAINQPCVKAITVRDDKECLIRNYIRNNQIRVREVYDPAICTAKTYKVMKDATSKTIGLGIAREDLYTDYGIDSVDREYLITFWKRTIELLEEKGYRWTIFTNGLDKDEAFAQAVLDEVGHGSKLKQPFDAKELVRQISQMQGMIACRMHSNIIAYALGISSVGLVWNEKMRFWGEKCGYSDRYIPYDQLRAEHVVAVLEDALKEGTKTPTLKMQYKTYQQIAYFIRKYATVRKKNKVLNLNISRHLVATALGGYEYKYKNLNSLSQLNESMKKGYRYFEVDVRMTRDDQLVCVNGWGEGTKKALGLQNSNEDLSLNEFMEAKYYQHFPTCTFEQFLESFSRVIQGEKVNVILDVGKPRSDKIDVFFEQLGMSLKKYFVEGKNIIVRVQRERDLKALLRQNYKCKKCYFISEEAAQEGKNGELYQKIIQFCKKNKIDMVSMTNKTWSIELQQLLSHEGLKTLILSYTTTNEIIVALQNGAEFVASHYYGVDYLNRLLY